MIGQGLTNIRIPPDPASYRDFRITQDVYVIDVTSRQTLRFGKIGPLGNLDKHLEGHERIQTKLKSELAGSNPGRSLTGSGTDVHRS